MAIPSVPGDFREFLKLLNSHQVRYLVVGGYAVAYHGYPRATVDLDIWIARDETNAAHVTHALEEFGFDPEDLSPGLFMEPNRVIRMGVPPLRLEIITSASGVEFEACYADRVRADVDGIEIPIISLHHLKINKRAVGRHMDLNDLEHLP